MCREIIPPARTSDQDPSWAPPLEALRHILVCYSCESLTGCRSTRGSTLRSPETGGRGVNTAQSSRRQPGRDASGTRSGDTGSPASPRVDTGPASHRPARGEQGPPPQQRQPAFLRSFVLLELGTLWAVKRPGQGDQQYLPSTRIPRRFTLNQMIRPSNWAGSRR